MKMRKLVAVLMAVLMLCCIVPFSAMAAGNSAVLDLTDKANRTSFSTSQQVWEQNGITVTNDKGASTSNVADYANPGRFYKSSTVTIEYPGMTSIVIDSVTYDDKDYAAPWAAIEDANVTATVTDGDVTIVFAEAVDSYTWETLSAQARAYSITVYTNGATPEAPEEPEEPEIPAGPAMEVVTEPDVDIAYKLGLDQTQKGAVYYFSGAMYNDYYGATDSDVTKGADVYLENAEDGYKVYFNDANGAKKYIAMVQSGNYVNFQIADNGTVFSFDTEKNALCADIGGEVCYMGNYGSYTNMATLKTSKLQDTDYIARLYAEPAEPEVPSDPAADSVLTIPQANELGLSKEPQTYTESKYYVTGKIVAVSNAQYGNVYIVDENNNQFLVYGIYGADGETRYDALEYVPVAGDTITVYGVIGTYNGTEAQMKNGWMTNYVKGEGIENTDPAADSVLTVKEAIELGLSKLHNVFTVNKYYVTAEITEIYNDMYGNMYVTDAEGNVLTIYGTYDADGTNRFDAMENQPVVGDTVKLYGIVGQYNGNPQMKNAYIVAINPVEEPEDPENPENPGDNGDEELEDNEQPGNTEKPEDEEIDSPDTGDNTAVFATLAVVMMALAAVVAAFTKKRA